MKIENTNINKKDILIIRNKNIILDEKLIKKRGYYVEEPYKYGDSFVSRLIRRIFFKFKLPFYRRWYNEKVLNYDIHTIVVFESLMTKEYVEWLRDVMKGKRIIIWYWNIAENTLSPEKIKKMNVELWSFSRKDCYTFDMKFNPAPYFREVLEENNETDIDILFIGKDKGRLDDLLEYEEKFKKKGFSTKFIIAPDKGYKKNKRYTKTLPYNEALRLSSRSKALFDYIETTDSGQSLRVFEALFSSKKLITNSELIKDYDFYNVNNIYVLQGDNIEGVSDFMKKKYVENSECILYQYDFEQWLSRFFTPNELFENMLIEYTKKKNS